MGGFAVNVRDYRDNTMPCPASEVLGSGITIAAPPASNNR